MELTEFRERDYASRDMETTHSPGQAIKETDMIIDTEWNSKFA